MDNLQIGNKGEVIMNKKDTQEAISEMLNIDFEKLNIDTHKDEFTLVKKFKDDQGILIKMEEVDGERELNLHVTGAMIVLPKEDVMLDVF